jgi:hypothetical protein
MTGVDERAGEGLAMAGSSCDRARTPSIRFMFWIIGLAPP